MSRDTPRLALVAHEVFDGERLLAGPHTLQLADGRLAALEPGDHGAALAARGFAVERAAFAMPGLVDAHVHLFLDGGPTDSATRAAHLKQPVEALAEAARRSARAALECGITLVRDAGDRHGINHRIRDEAADPHSGLAAVRSGGLGVKRPKRYGTFMATDVDSDDAIRASVQRLAERSDEIKLILTGIIDFELGAVTDEPQFDADAASLVVRCAHAQGRKVFAHCSGAKGLAVATAAGIDSIEHGFFMDRDTLARMRDRDLAWTPTFCPVHFQWAQPQAAGWRPAAVDQLRRILDGHARHLALAHEMGVRVMLGTDAGSMGVRHGAALFDEIDRFVEAGWPLQDVLAAATSVPRRHFGHAHPSLAPGAPFDVLALDASPFARRQALREPRQVWRDGVACVAA